MYKSGKLWLVAATALALTISMGAVASADDATVTNKSS